MNPLTQSKKTTILPLLIALVLGCFALSPAARALDPQPDGGYPNENTAEGDGALQSLDVTTGLANTAVGFLALSSLTTRYGNTAVGDSALLADTIGIQNTAVGWGALETNDGADNTAIGVDALAFNATGSENTAIGEFALQENQTGSDNTAIGGLALMLPGGSNNTATGYQAMFGSGDQILAPNDNTADGAFALLNITTGNSNTATGEGALTQNTSGGNNTADGWQALSMNTTGNGNIALGVTAGDRLTTGSNNIDIGNSGVTGESGKIRIGTVGIQTATFVAGINGAGVTGAAVKVNAAGQLGTAPSSQRFKMEIKPMDKASEAIYALKPVSFRYKKEIDPELTRQFGLVAEEVEKVNPDLVARDEQGKPYSVRYEAVNAMLLNEFLKEHRKVEKLEATIAQQHKDFEAVVAELKGQIQKVSAQLELSKSAPQTVLNNQ